MLRLVGHLFARFKSRKNQTIRHRAVPLVEELQARVLPAGPVSVSSHTLLIEGSQKADTVLVRTTPTQVIVTFNARTFKVGAARVNQVVFHGNAGNDRFTLVGKLKVTAD